MSHILKKEPDWDKLTITNDHVFFTLMKSPDVAKEILERCLSVKVKELKYLELQKSIDVLYDGKGVRLDVYIEDDDKIYNVEMQVVEKRDLRRRLRFYQSIIDMERLSSGELYSNLKDVIIILICPFDMFKREKPVYTFINMCIECDGLRLDDGVQKVIINASSFLEEQDRKRRNLLAYIYGEKVENDTFIDMLATKIHEIKNNKEWRIEHMKINLREQDAFYDGMQEGKIEGKLEEQLKIARNFLDLADDATIATKTGLPLEKVQELRNEALSMAN